MVGVGVRVVVVVESDVCQRRVVLWVALSLSLPLSSGQCSCSLAPLAHSSCSPPLSLPLPLGGLVGTGPVGLGDDDVGVVQEGTGAQVVVVDRLGVGLQVALHVLGVEGEVGAQHG